MAESDKRNDILQAASQCFARFGFSKTTMEDIGRQVGLNKASIYYYYKNKEAIFTEIIEEEGQAVLDSLQERISGIPDWDEQIQAYFKYRQQYFHENANIHTLHTAEQLQVQPMFKTLAAEFSSREKVMIRSILDGAAAEGLIRQINRAKAAEVILSLANSLTSACKDPWESADPELEKIGANIHFALSLLLDGLRAADCR